MVFLITVTRLIKRRIAETANKMAPLRDNTTVVLYEILSPNALLIRSTTLIRMNPVKAV